MGVSLDPLRFNSLLALRTPWASFQVKNNISVSTALTLVLHMCTVNRHLHGSGERNGEQGRTKVSFGRTMMQALEVLWLVKGTSWDVVISTKIKPVALAIYRVMLV